jgi:hypothetical protein
MNPTYKPEHDSSVSPYLIVDGASRTVYGNVPFV